jgi:hypothetical protein
MRWRYLLGVPVALIAAWAAFVAALPLLIGVHLTSAAGGALLFSPAAVGFLAYALFIVLKLLPIGVTRWRYLLGIPVALIAALAVFFAGILPEGLWVFLGVGSEGYGVVTTWC